MLFWTVTASVVTYAKPDAIWKLWTDVENWPAWDDGLKWCKLHGPFVSGTKGELKPIKGPAAKFQLKDVEINKTFSDVSEIPLTSLAFTHTIEKISEGKYQVTHKAFCKGFLAPLLWFSLRRCLKSDMPHAVKKLTAMAEGKKHV